MKHFIWTLIAIEIGILLGAMVANALAADHQGVHLTGRISAIAEEAEEGRFAIIGNAGSVTIDVSAWDYITDYLKANNGKEITLRLEYAN